MSETNLGHMVLGGLAAVELFAAACGPQKPPEDSKIVVPPVTTSVKSQTPTPEVTFTNRPIDRLMQIYFQNYDYVTKDKLGVEAFGVKELKNPKGSGEFTQLVNPGAFLIQDTLRTRVGFAPDNPYIGFQVYFTYTPNSLLITVALGDLETRQTTDSKQHLICNFNPARPSVLTWNYNSYILADHLKFNGQDYDLKAPACQ